MRELFLAACFAWLLGAAPAPAQVQGHPPPPPPDDDITRRIYNSAPAEHHVEVGRYYLKKEKYDAAIDRFKQAIELLPKYALPYRLMGEAYEKKRFFPEAVAETLFIDLPLCFLNS